ncbi:MAG: hypothetical protein IJU50_04675, partial [Lachnospiraceae bacterium]|nr:hypothetical protein [Lachnospiraceae bacterium]
LDSSIYIVLTLPGIIDYKVLRHNPLPPKNRLFIGFTLLFYTFQGIYQFENRAVLISHTDPKPPDCRPLDYA